MDDVDTGDEEEGGVEDGAEDGVEETDGERTDPTAQAYRLAAEVVGGTEKLPDDWQSAYAQGAGQQTALLPHVLKGDFEHGSYHWGFAERSDRGKRIWGSGLARIRIEGDGPAFFRMLEKRRGKPLEEGFVGIGGQPFALVTVRNVRHLAGYLEKAGADLFAAALRLCLPVWRARAKAEEAEIEARRQAEVQAEKDLAEQLGVDVDLLDTIRELARAAQRLADVDHRRSEAYYTRACEGTAALLKEDFSAGIVDKAGYPGLEEYAINGGKWRTFFERRGGEQREMIAIYSGPGKPTWHKASEALEKKAAYRDFGTKAYLVWPIKYALIASRALEADHFELALSIRLALCYDTPKDLHEELETMAAAREISEIPNHTLREKIRDLVDEIPFPSGHEPMQHQEVGIAYAILAEYRALIGDAPGLGKTLQAIGALSHGWNDLLPALVVCPASVVDNWADEIRSWAPWFTPEVVEGHSTPPPPDRSTIYVCSWNSLPVHVEGFQLRGLKCVVFDESQFAKNPTAKRSKAARVLAHSTPGCLLLSGTAMENKSRDIWHQLHLIDPVEFPTLADFKARYAQPKKRKVGDRHFVDDTGENLEELGYRLRGYMIRRLKTDVLSALPDKTRRLLWTHLTPTLRKRYDAAKANIEEWMVAKRKAARLQLAAQLFVRAVERGAGPGWQTRKAKHRPLLRAALHEACEAANSRPIAPPQAMTKLNELRQLVGRAKIPAAVQWIDDFRDTTGGDALVVFCQHRAVVEGIAGALARPERSCRWISITGSTPTNKRTAIVKAFQAGEYDVILCTKAAMTGVTLTRASNVLFVERWWVPAHEEQAEDRIHRITQKDAVYAWYLMARGTIDTHIAKLVDSKRSATSRVLGTEDVDEEEHEHHAERDKALVTALVQEIVTEIAHGIGADDVLHPKALVGYLKDESIL